MVNTTSVTPRSAPQLDCDLCIVGAGAAGIALASELSQSGLKILLIESGARDRGEVAAHLNKGETEGFRFTGLTEGRARAFGGATLLWAGQCIRMDPIDFEKRDWVPHSGWPITLADLADPYDRAERFMGLRQPIYDDGIWRSFGVDAPKFSGGIEPKFTIYCQEPDFAKAYGPSLDAAGVQLLLETTVVEIVPQPNGKQISHLVVARTTDGRARTIRARWYVLAGGGIENPRMLLSSRQVMRDGIGNDHDLVGRFLQDHPSGKTAVLKVKDMGKLQKLFAKRRRDGLRFWPKLALTSQTQRSEQILNGNAYPVYEYGGNTTAAALHRLRTALRERQGGAQAADLLHALKGAPLVIREMFQSRREHREPVLPASVVSIQAFTEQAPSPDNRVSLAQEMDGFGVQRAKVSWQLSEIERRTLRVVTERVGAELGRHGMADAELADWVDGPLEAISGKVQDAFHHAGTTRMSLDPKTGVVDTNGQVHGIENLFIAGGSVMPTSGYANPTLTIIALAIRTGDEIRRRFRAERWE